MWTFAGSGVGSTLVGVSLRSRDGSVAPSMSTWTRSVRVTGNGDGGADTETVVNSLVRRSGPVPTPVPGPVPGPAPGATSMLATVFAISTPAWHGRAQSRANRR